MAYSDNNDTDVESIDDDEAFEATYSGAVESSTAQFAAQPPRGREVSNEIEQATTEASRATRPPQSPWNLQPRASQPPRSVGQFLAPAPVQRAQMVQQQSAPVAQSPYPPMPQSPYHQMPQSPHYMPPSPHMAQNSHMGYPHPFQAPNPMYMTQSPRQMPQSSYRMLQSHPRMTQSPHRHMPQSPHPQMAQRPHPQIPPSPYMAPPHYAPQPGHAPPQSPLFTPQGTPAMTPQRSPLFTPQDTPRFTPTPTPGPHSVASTPAPFSVASTPAPESSSRGQARYGMGPRPKKKRGPKPKPLSERKMPRSTPIVRKEATYSTRKKEEVITWMLQTRVERRGQMVAPSTTDAENHFRIPRSTIAGWKMKYLGPGPIIKKPPPDDDDDRPDAP
ncbi:hypothetical protein FPANT_7482 [Fusarium pseudoanthophilum]|uniref:Uncharacterized protein n=1 Tax=Fusarium pseudoanthophilum TaxID=48495 RepID=A0A8H5P3Y7_9HYPO|nr:hypothetical protein FPANT_7482 [Fusarium pseudoanthophilum]